MVHPAIRFLMTGFDMFGTLRRSWQFAKISYGILWDFKYLTVFPVFSTIAAVAVTASFLLPLWGIGVLDEWLTVMDDETAGGHNVAMYLAAFLFYFCNYFVIIFFNSALTACAMKVVSGEAPTVGYGLSMARKRLPQIFAWALVSAVVGVVLKAIENAHEKAGRFVAAILGSAWTALAYFVVPVIVIDGVGPVEAFKRSAGTLKSTWGEALTGGFSLGLLGLLILLPGIVLLGGLFFFVAGQSTALAVLVGVLAVGLIVLGASINSAADVIFKAILFNYATGQSGASADRYLTVPRSLHPSSWLM